jgi:hypothetical protein
MRKKTGKFLIKDAKKLYLKDKFRNPKLNKKLKSRVTTPPCVKLNYFVNKFT